MSILCGIDEAGRGPLAGPLVISGVILNNKINGLNDSKKLTDKKRRELFKIIKENSTFYVVFISNQYIDENGLSLSLQTGLKEIMSKLKADNYLFDGNTTYGIQNLNCEIKADLNVAQVSAASIIAKVSRDNYMKSISKKFPHYSFGKHKGYGTKAHLETIKKYGLSKLHRKSYKIKSLEETQLTLDV